ncbi:hypothetical protein DY000_02009548, partial [Brassica cretica]
MSESWSVLDLIPDCEIDYYQRGVTLKGDTYFFARGTAPREMGNYELIGLGVFMLCFDYTKERFEPHLTLPFTITDNHHEAVVLSCVREEQLAVLYEKSQSNILDFWVTNKIESNAVPWSKFLKVDLTIKPPRHPLGHRNHGSFFIDEEKKVAVVFDRGLNDSSRHYATTAFIVGEEGYFTSVNIGKKPTSAGNPANTSAVQVQTPGGVDLVTIRELAELKQSVLDMKDRMLEGPTSAPLIERVLAETLKTPFSRKITDDAISRSNNFIRMEEDTAAILKKLNTATKPATVPKAPEARQEPRQHTSGSKPNQPKSFVYVVEDKNASPQPTVVVREKGWNVWENDEKPQTSSTPPASSPGPAEPNMWCSFHKSKAHDTRNCRHLLDALFS